ncbi:MAG: VOC family protein [Methanomicrobiales archaeon]|nr:VOC family protein [Methanomicrobiales archaeon]MDD1658579.1 VOC family protein [Methanomicrobiales archaeon]
MPTIVHFDLPAEDLARARKFYGELFGWTFVRPPAPMEYYLIMTTGLDGSPGVGGGMGKRGAPDQRMTNYFGVPSIDQYLEKAKALGATVVMPKNTVPYFGYLAICVDTEGNPFGLWEEDPKAR